MRFTDNIGLGKERRKGEKEKRRKGGEKAGKGSDLRSIFWQLQPDGIVHDYVRPAHQTAQPSVHDIYGPKHSLASLVNHSPMHAQHDANMHGSCDMHIGGIFPIHLDQIG